MYYSDIKSYYASKNLYLSSLQICWKEKTLKVNDQSKKQLKHRGFFKDFCKILDMKNDQVFFEYNQKSVVDEKYNAWCLGF